jgi:hypothetical protein
MISFAVVAGYVMGNFEDAKLSVFYINFSHMEPSAALVHGWTLAL